VSCSSFPRKPVLSLVEGRRSKSGACFDFALRA
jgi:hypothetical protein